MQPSPFHVDQAWRTKGEMCIILSRRTVVTCCNFCCSPDDNDQGPVTNPPVYSLSEFTHVIKQAVGMLPPPPHFETDGIAEW